MTAPSPFCAVHPFGTTTMCGPCRDARVASAARIAEQVGRVGRADADGNVRVDPQVDTVTAREIQAEWLRARARMQSTKDIVKMLNPERVSAVRVKVVDDAAVVDLNSHGRKRIARRILVVAAVAVVSLWAVAS